MFSVAAGAKPAQHFSSVDSRYRKTFVKPSGHGIFFVASFALGIVIISREPGYAGSLQQFLFGSITGFSNTDLMIVVGTALITPAASARLLTDGWRT